MLKKDIARQLTDGTGCVGKSGDYEPMFVLVGRDAFSGDCVRVWADIVERAAKNRPGGVSEELTKKIAEARQCAKAMDDYPNKKFPD